MLRVYREISGPPVVIGQGRQRWLLPHLRLLNWAPSPFPWANHFTWTSFRYSVNLGLATGHQLKVFYCLLFSHKATKESHRSLQIFSSSRFLKSVYLQNCNSRRANTSTCKMLITCFQGFTDTMNLSVFLSVDIALMLTNKSGFYVMFNCYFVQIGCKSSTDVECNCFFKMSRYGHLLIRLKWT